MKRSMKISVFLIAVSSAIISACGSASTEDEGRVIYQELTSASAQLKASSPTGRLKIAKRCDSPKKVLICHIPPGNPANAHDICVGLPAQPAHEKHGDKLGACGPVPMNPGDDVEGDDGDDNSQGPGNSDKGKGKGRGKDDCNENTGGVPSTGGSTASGGSESTGGSTAANGGSNGTGGSTSTGGAASNGGSPPDTPPAQGGVVGQ